MSLEEATSHARKSFVSQFEHLWVLFLVLVPFVLP